MNLKRFCLGTGLLLLLLSGCKKPGDDPIDPDVEVDFLDLSLTVINFGYEKDASLIVVETDLAWTADCPASWIELSAYQGNESTGFIIGAQPNTNFPRETTLTITAGDKTKEILINQAGVDKIEFSIDGVDFRFLPVEADTSFYLDGATYLASRQVYLDSYFISETEITIAQWLAITGSLPAGNVSYQSNMPVVVNWNEISNTFLPAINELLNYQFRLPTENEWEVAARGGLNDDNTSYAGSMYVDDVAWHYQNSEGRKHAVAQKLPNELGLYDMSGNVSEWCSDWFADWTEANPPPSPSNNPTGPANGTEKVIRGGDFLADRFEYDLNSCNVYARNYLPPGIDTEDFLHNGYYHFTGFRLVIPKNQ
jgi:formylglycine-generating enzyme required for sulfatase activity